MYIPQWLVEILFGAIISGMGLWVRSLHVRIRNLEMDAATNEATNKAEHSSMGRELVEIKAMLKEIRDAMFDRNLIGP